MKRSVYTLFFVFFLVSLLRVNLSVQAQTNHSRALTTLDTLLFESFDYTPGELPPGWVLEGAQASWSVNNSNGAGGDAPELALGFSFASGTSRLIAPPVNIAGNSELCITYKQYLINYEMDYGEIIALDITFDGGQSWQPLWENPLGLLNIPQDEFTYYFTAPEGATEVQFAFRYEGNCYAINWWLIDDILVASAPDNDLMPCYFAGYSTPLAGMMDNCFVQVRNGGSTLQTDYTVKLMMEGGIELASVPGDSIAFGEQKFFMVSWTPGEELIGNTTFIYVEVEFAGDEFPDNNQSVPIIINVQPEGISSVQIGNGLQPLSSLPYNFFNLHSISQTLYFPDEIGMSGSSITGIQYTCQFDQDVSVPLQIYMGETTQNDLSTGWIDPAGLILVFDGTVNFAKGFQSIFIPLDNAYNYEGGNLVVYSLKSYNEMVLGTPFICSIDTSSNRSRSAEQDDLPFDPMNPPESSYTMDYYPNITLFYTTGSTSISTEEIPPAISLFPIPASDKLFVQSDEPILDLRMINAAGQAVSVETTGNQPYKINTGHLETGFYLLQVRTAKGTSIHKVMISK